MAPSAETGREPAEAGRGFARRRAVLAGKAPVYAPPHAATTRDPAQGLPPARPDAFQVDGGATASTAGGGEWSMTMRVRVNSGEGTRYSTSLPGEARSGRIQQEVQALSTPPL